MENEHAASAGFVYILSNPSMPNIVKIGSTERSVKERVAELSSTTGVPTPFAIEYSLIVENPKEIEFFLHEEFGEHRVNGAREFFRISPEIGVARLLEIRQEMLVREFRGWGEDDLIKFLERMWRVHKIKSHSDEDGLFSKNDVFEAIRNMPTLGIAEILERLFRDRPDVWKVVK